MCHHIGSDSAFHSVNHMYNCGTIMAYICIPLVFWVRIRTSFDFQKKVKIQLFTNGLNPYPQRQPKEYSQLSI